MRGKQRHAPVFVDTFDLCQWLLGRLATDRRPLALALARTALALLEAVTLAVKDRRREERIEWADERLQVLRVQLRLAGELALLSESQMLFALEMADRIGRQLGGWWKSLAPL